MWTAWIALNCLVGDAIKSSPNGRLVFTLPPRVLKTSETMSRFLQGKAHFHITVSPGRAPNERNKHRHLSGFRVCHRVCKKATPWWVNLCVFRQGRGGRLFWCDVCTDVCFLEGQAVAGIISQVWWPDLAISGLAEVTRWEEREKGRRRRRGGNGYA